VFSSLNIEMEFTMDLYGWEMNLSSSIILVEISLSKEGLIFILR